MRNRYATCFGIFLAFAYGHAFGFWSLAWDSAFPAQSFAATRDTTSEQKADDGAIARCKLQAQTNGIPNTPNCQVRIRLNRDCAAYLTDAHGGPLGGDFKRVRTSGEATKLTYALCDGVSDCHSTWLCDN